MLIARWLEREVLRLKKLGVSFAAAADMITQAAHGDHNGVQLPDANVVTLPPDYSVTAMGCCKALRRSLNREPAQAAEDYREVDTRRLEDWLLNLAARIQKGDTEAIKTGLNLLKHKAELNGYALPPHKQFEDSNRISAEFQIQTGRGRDLRTHFVLRIGDE